MASYPPPYPPPMPPPGFDPRDQRRFLRDQQKMQERMLRDAARAHSQQLRLQARSLRRGSILAPILLISVGILFLLIQTGRLQHQLFWAWYGRHWPVLLVGAGIVLLAEWAFDQVYLRNPEHVQYRRSIGGGVFTLLLIFGVVGFVDQARLHINGDKWFYGWQFNPDDLDQFLGDKHESDQTMDLAFPAGGSLAVVNPRGDVTVSGTSDDNRIHLAIHKQVYTRTDSDADAKTRQLNPALATSGTSVSLTMPAIEGTRSDLVLTVPPAAITSITANHGDIHASAIKASINATANHGDIELSAITGPAAAHINNRDSSLSAHSMGSAVTIEGHADDITLSDITGPVSISGDFFGTTHLERVAAPIHFHTSRTDFQLARLDGEVEISPDSDLSADQALGPVVLTTHGRNIKLDRIAGDVSVTNRNGSVDLTAAPGATGQMGSITLEDRNGSIKTILPEHAGFSLQADTTNGDINTDLPLSATTDQGTRDTRTRDNHRTLNGTIGSGGPLVHITTTNGDISIDKGTIAPLPAAPPAPPKLTIGPVSAPTHTIPPVAPRAPAAPKPRADHVERPAEN